jgi:two-component system, OmpR family, osmolarity sensor histidine kinase EnvZ
MVGRAREFIRKTPVLRLPERIISLLGQGLKPIMPRSLNGRFVFIIIAPVILIQVISTYLYMERYSQQVTRRLSNGVAGEIAFIISATEMKNGMINRDEIFKHAFEHENLNIKIIENETLPQPLPEGFFTFISSTMREQLESKIKKPIWFDLERRPSMVEIRIQLDNAVMAIEVRRSKIIATNWHIFLVWIVIASCLLVGIAILFLRIQVRAILRLGLAAENFGKGRDVPDFKPSGATEVRNAAEAVIDMRDRINAHVSQRTEMLAGVSHDLRTPLTRLKLQLAILGDTPDLEEMKTDISEMEYMLQEYLDFARGQATESASPQPVKDILNEIKSGASRKNFEIDLNCPDDLTFTLRRLAFKRCITNLVNNASTFGSKVVVTATGNETGALVLSVDDDGPGIPPDRREEAFRPFHRLDEGRNLDQGGTGLGLAIAQDVAKAHGGSIELQDSPLGGLRALVTLPG